MVAMCVAARVRALALSLLLLPGNAGAARAQSASAFSQAPAWDGPPLSLAEAVGEALQANASLVATRAGVAPLAERPAQERSLMPPRVEGQIWQWPLTTLSPAKVDMYMFLLEQEFPGRGKRELRATNAEKELATAEADVESRRLEVMGEVRRAYITLALARRDLLAAFETGRALEQLVESAQATYAAGGGSQAAVVKALLDVTRVQERMASIAGEERMGVARLNTILGRVPGAPIGALNEPRVDSARGRVTDPASANFDRHPDVRAARAAVEQAQSALAVAEHEGKPDWMVQGGYMLIPGEAGAWTARVGLTWPTAPWAKPRLTASVREATARRDAAMAAVATAESRVRLMVAEAAARLAAAEARLSVLRGTLVPEARHLVEATRLAYQNAQGTLGDALDARLMLLEAQLDEARALREAELARADLDSAIGDAPVATAVPGATGTLVLTRPTVEH
jgi:outer membrane protein, heavy metal efflux system